MKIVAWTSWATSQSTIANASPTRPPMSNVNAIWSLVREPCLISLLAGGTVAVGFVVGFAAGRGVRRGVARGVGRGDRLGAAVGRGVVTGTGVSTADGLGADTDGDALQLDDGVAAGLGIGEPCDG